MNDKQYKRLAPFLIDKRARQRLILFLIADGFTVIELVAMRVGEFHALKLPIEMQVCRDEVLDRRSSGPAFVYPGGAPLPYTAYYRLLRRTAEKVLGQPMSQEMFRAYIQSAKKGAR